MYLALLLLLLFGQEESPIARHGSIYPHPPDPVHLQPVKVDVGFAERKRVLFWTYREPFANAKIRIEQERAAGGWFVCATRYLDADGHFTGDIPIDGTLRNPTVVLAVLLDANGRELQHVEVSVASEKLSMGIRLEGQ